MSKKSRKTIRENKTKQVIEYYKHGTVKKICTKQDGVDIGSCTIYHENGKIKATSEEDYEDIIFKTSNYDIFGNLDYEYIYGDAGKTTIIDYENGKKIKETTYYLSSNNEFSTTKNWFSNGTIHKKSTCHNKLLTGKMYIYNIDGTLHKENNYKKGKLHGRCHVWNGQQKIEETNYVNGLEHGPTVEWHYNGNKDLIGNYNMGAKQGRWKFWDYHSGHLRLILNYNDDVKVGIVINFTYDYITKKAINVDDGDSGPSYTYHWDNEKCCNITHHWYYLIKLIKNKKKRYMNKKLRTIRKHIGDFNDVEFMTLMEYLNWQEKINLLKYF